MSELIGSDTGPGIDDRDFQVPGSLTGRLEKSAISLEPPTPAPEDKKEPMKAQANAADAKQPEFKR